MMHDGWTVLVEQQRTVQAVLFAYIDRLTAVRVWMTATLKIPALEHVPARPYLFRDGLAFIQSNCVHGPYRTDKSTRDARRRTLSDFGNHSRALPSEIFPRGSRRSTKFPCLHICY